MFIFISFWMLCFKNHITRKKNDIYFCQNFNSKNGYLYVSLDDSKWHFRLLFTPWHFLTFTNKMNPPIVKFISIFSEQNGDIDLSRHQHSIWLPNVHGDKSRFRCSVSHWINTPKCTFITPDVPGFMEHFIYSPLFPLRGAS